MMKKKKSYRSSGNALRKDPGVDERVLPEGAEEALEKDEAERRLKLLDLKDKIASGRYSVSSSDVAKSIINHAAEDRRDDISTLPSKKEK